MSTYLFLSFFISSRPYSIVTACHHPAKMDHEPPVKKRGRPKGSKDKPRQPGDKPRGRPRKAPKLAAQVSDAAGVDSKSDSLTISLKN